MTDLSIVVRPSRRELVRNMLVVVGVGALIVFLATRKPRGAFTSAWVIVALLGLAGMLMFFAVVMVRLRPTLIATDDGLIVHGKEFAWDDLVRVAIGHQMGGLIVLNFRSSPATFRIRGTTESGESMEAVAEILARRRALDLG